MTSSTSTYQVEGQHAGQAEPVPPPPRGPRPRPLQGPYPRKWEVCLRLPFHTREATALRGKGGGGPLCPPVTRRRSPGAGRDGMSRTGAQDRLWGPESTECARGVLGSGDRQAPSAGPPGRLPVPAASLRPPGLPPPLGRASSVFRSLWGGPPSLGSPDLGWEGLRVKAAPALEQRHVSAREGAPRMHP